MHKLFGKRGFAVFTSLALCVSLVSPSFAATFDDLQKAIRNEEGYDKEAITVEAAEDGKQLTVTLKQNIERAEGQNAVVVSDYKNTFGDITINLNGKTIDGKNSGGAVLEVKDGKSVTIQDKSAEQTGTITGGNHAEGNGNGGGIIVSNGSLTLEGGAIKGNTAGVSGGGVYVDGGSSFTMTGGEISGNTANATGGGGVFVENGSFTMTDGAIKDNTSAMSGGGVGLHNADASFVMDGGEISGNTAKNSDSDTAQGGGGGVWVREGASFEMNKGTITGNTVNGANGNSGGVAAHRGNFTMNGGTISGNTASKGSGVFVSAEKNGGSFTMTGGTIDETTTVADDGTDVKVTITDGIVSDLDDEKYLDDGHGLLPNGDDTYKIVEHGDDKHYFVDGACQVRGCDAVQPVEPEPEEPVEEPTEEPVETVDPIEVDAPEIEIEIDEPAVPLAAGPVTRGEFIDYLWRHEGEPEADLVVDHEYAEALSWAQSIGIISIDEFEPDELVTVGVARDILSNFAAYSDMVMPVLTTLTGDEDEAVLNCDEVLAEFFGEELSE